MLVTLIVALVIVNAGWLLLADRRDARDRAERASWLQRIQNPHAAVAEHHAQVAPPVIPMPASPLPMSDEEMAALAGGPVSQSVRDIIAQMEAVENGFEQPQDGVLP